LSRILVVDDETAVLDAVRGALESAGYRVQVARDGESALRLARLEPPDLIILDILLPGISGLEVCRIIRQESGIPILMLTALGDETDKVAGLEQGADDYLTKPFGARELLARVRALLRRAAVGPPAQGGEGTPHPLRVAHILRYGDIEIDLFSRRASRRGNPLNLKPREFDLLAFLICHRGETFSPAQLLRLVWQYQDTSDIRTVTVHIHRLRRKLGDDPLRPRLIQTVTGAGYRFAP